MISQKAKDMCKAETVERTQKIGEDGENNFVLACRKNKIPVNESSEYNNIHRHVDFYIFGDVAVDVKGYKNSHEEGFPAIEFKNVNGKAGWCSKESDAQLIAFQVKDYFLIFRREEILQYCSKVVKKVYVDHWEMAYRHLYRRDGRQDVITRLSFEHDLLPNMKFQMKLYF